MKRTLLNTLGIAGASVGTYMGGCTTAYQTENDISRVNRSTIESLERMPGQVSTNEMEISPDCFPLSYQETLNAQKEYGSLPAHASTIYFVNVDGRETYARVLDTTGPLNKAFGAVNRIKEAIPSDPEQRTRLNIGAPDSAEFASARSAGNQLSSRSGLLGIDTYCAAEQGNVAIEVNKLTGIKGGRNAEKYDISITFGTTEFSQRQRVRDPVYLLETAEMSGIGLLIAGPAGAAGGAAIEGIDGLWAYFEGSHAPRGTNLIGDRGYISHPETSAQVSDTRSVLENSAKLGTDQIICFDYDGKDGNNLGVIYTHGAENIHGEGNVLHFTTNNLGVNHLRAFLLNGLKVGGGIGTARALYNNHTNNGGNTPATTQPTTIKPTATGGRTGAGPGGAGSTGGTIRGAGGK